MGIEQDSLSRSYDEMFGSRSSSFVKPGSVASMFSPTGYLTELYRSVLSSSFIVGCAYGVTHALDVPACGRGSISYVIAFCYK
ncbi:hypothetical protein [Xenorhabdus sp. PB62.4]|uniref:hypothetical protein n=1 Tax=Xenorhabdus sp. PB62.4 TaxID=1851573 RepID=UPI002104D9C7|nr:hypothetical protein [Xenorhabdus sp. PB62.4]